MPKVIPLDPASDWVELSSTEEDWDRCFAVNAKGTFLCSRVAARSMVAAGRIDALAPWVSWPVIDTVPIERPWKLLWVEMIVVRCGAPATTFW